jgi:hypothetical protein
VLLLSSKYEHCPVVNRDLGVAGGEGEECWTMGWEGGL